jgi:hypothetical protein
MIRGIPYKNTHLASEAGIVTSVIQYYKPISDKTRRTMKPYPKQKLLQDRRFVQSRRKI